MPNSRNRDDGRPKVGPADAATRRRILGERLAEREPAGLYAAKKPATAAPAKSATSDLSVTGAARKIRARPSVIDKAVDE